MCFLFFSNLFYSLVSKVFLKWKFLSWVKKNLVLHINLYYHKLQRVRSAQKRRAPQDTCAKLQWEMGNEHGGKGKSKKVGEKCTVSFQGIESWIDFLNRD